jgi:hypothetical protein
MLAAVLAMMLQAAEPAPDFSWLTGHWVRTSETRTSEEIWTAADGALMTGMNRTVRADGRTSFEYVRIEFAPAEGGPPVYVAQPSGGDAVRFTLVEHGETSALFANPDHDFPTHIAYARDGDMLTARIWGPDGEGEAIAWRWSLRAE